MPNQKVLIAGVWRDAASVGSFSAANPATGESLPDQYPISAWSDCDAALDASAAAARILRDTPPDRLAAFLNLFADRIQASARAIVEIAHTETALANSPRLAEIELPRTIDQLRQAARAALDGSWAIPTIDSKRNIRSCHAPIGPVCVFGPNNFPFAYNGICGGDFAAAIAAGNPVIAKAHPCHPGTTKLFAQEAFAAVGESGLPPATVQMIYHLRPEDGLRLVSDRRLGATGFTGSRAAGLALKAAADAAGKPIYLEMSSLNPVIVLPGALRERIDAIADQYADSCLSGAGQFCTKPGLLFLIAGESCERFIEKIRERFVDRPVLSLLAKSVLTSLDQSVQKLQAAGAQLVVGGNTVSSQASQYANTLLRVEDAAFLKDFHALQTEAFGNASMIVVARDADRFCQIIETLEGQLTGSIYSSSDGTDDELYARISPLLRQRVGRFLNDKMPTGVAVTPSMNHGGPYPATGHPGFTAVGIPASLRRFSQLECYDNVRSDRLPPILRDRNPNPTTCRLVDGQWSNANIST
jgi:NADP-dependent aldehyde dehydrogenase